MRRRLTLASALMAILLVFVLPASTVSAATFTYNITKDICTASGGSHGYGHIVMKTRVTEWGRSGANRFTVKVTVQLRHGTSSVWHAVKSWPLYTWRFPNDEDDYWLTSSYDYDPKASGSHMMQMDVKIWGGSTLLGLRSLKGKIC
jgi:hypothetical protein